MCASRATAASIAPSSSPTRASTKSCHGALAPPAASARRYAPETVVVSGAAVETGEVSARSLKPRLRVDPQNP
jgi:hypothetical protein